MKKTILLAIAFVLIFALAACKSSDPETAVASISPALEATPDEPPVSLPNPVVEVEGAADFADLGFIITPHQQADSASYSIISGKIAQIIFTLDGETFTYRGAVTRENISGVYASFDPLPQTMELEGPGFKVTLVVKTIDGGKQGALAEWGYEDVMYSFYTEDPTNFDNLTDVLLPIVYNDLPFAACCG